MLNEANAWANKTQVITSDRGGLDRISTRDIPSLQPSDNREGTGRINSDIQEMINQTFRGKENLTLKPYLRTYGNVQENVKAFHQASSRYQLIHEAKPKQTDNVSSIRPLVPHFLHTLVAQNVICTDLSVETC